MPRSFGENSMKSAGFCFACVLVLLTTAAAQADNFYLGTWKLTSAVVAPWADSKRKPDEAEKTRLIGKSVVIAPRQISGPNPFACAAPRYKLSDVTADMLFQGAFDEMKASNKSADPGKLAASLGFSGNRIQTLETGCEIDFHFVDATTAEIGLNDHVYTLKKQ
jgi:hypothetical protein